ncbi:hypothetical protein [uncultured Rikenella sp.]|uniref:hypothetical protein n=1 Tax=uncultured Rikenella sp. TaxID=368003 RepID=UPI00262F424F|nr:hypothetical protein [uncultured Rikenella sp.]
METKKLKPFDLEVAKAGAAVVTRDGRPARIVCFDAAGDYPVIALIRYGTDEEVPQTCTLTGNVSYTEVSDDDLFMAPVKRQGWVNLRFIDDKICAEYKVYRTKDAAKSSGITYDDYVATVPVEWEE